MYNGEGFIIIFGYLFVYITIYGDGFLPLEHHHVR